MNIQLATAEDAPTLAQIHVTTWQTAYVGMIDSDYLNNLDVSKITSDWQNALSKPSPGITVIGKQDDHAIGFAVYGPTRDEGVDKTKTAELVALNVLPDYWRHGYGKEFFSH
ncbi:MAG: GNAT family N-acetyltransferase, partial [Gammaproteobacteria bacterium]|nr:GNAT family N-acetyltransferase [Gammaproteobacteria bacterium]